ncbi:unnamed protein product [Dibothriocephalus latus]|uniref:Uncharacterized protein n=1 Tax=Dibothriocephalus latus TaxID=60516 RepID=A0A3P7MVR9_DIBLA|nr:unnamed protein product [Dibothriocephalus latus]
MRVFQKSSASSDALLVLSVDEVGADIALRRWDQEIKQCCLFAAEQITVIIADDGGVGDSSLYPPSSFTPQKAHVNSIKIVVPRFHERDSKEPVCLAETSQKTRANNLFSLRLLIVDKVAPNFLTEYEHTRHHLTCEFKTLKVRAVFSSCIFDDFLIHLSSLSHISSPAHSATIFSGSGADHFKVGTK